MASEVTRKTAASELAAALTERGEAEQERQDHKAARATFREAQDLLRKSGGQPSARLLKGAGLSELVLGDHDRALAFLLEALATYRRLGQVRGTIITLYTIAECQRRLDRHDEALAALDEARPLAEKAEQNRDLSSILLLLSLIHEEMQDYRRALVFHRRYHDLWVRLFDEEKTRQTVEMQTRYDVERKERENELLKREKHIAALAVEKQRSQRDFLFFVALLVLLLAVALYRGFRVKARSNRWLEEANSRIVAQQGKLEEAYRVMEDLARRDQLTGLPNRRAALEEIEREERRFQRSQKPFTLVMADLVGFKAVNDMAGHDAGDDVLKATAGIFYRSLRAQDTVARWGGDEFLFLLPETEAEGARVICDSIQKKVESHEFSFSGQRLTVTISLGTGTFRKGGTIEECLREADLAMYRVRGGRAPAGG